MMRARPTEITTAGVMSVQYETMIAAAETSEAMAMVYCVEGGLSVAQRSETRKASTRHSRSSRTRALSRTEKRASVRGRSGRKDGGK